MKMAYFDEALELSQAEIAEMGISRLKKLAVITYDPGTEGRKLAAIEEEMCRAGYSFDGAESTDVCVVRSKEEYRELRKLYDKLSKRKLSGGV